MKLTRYGRREWLSALMVAICVVCLFICLAVFGLIPWSTLATIVILVMAVWLAFAAFFRDPDRRISAPESMFLSPADGTIRDIELIKNESIESEQLRDLFHGRDMLRIGIFLSVLNVHLNRTPCAMTAKFREYKPGAFHDARDGRASKENESMILGGEGTIGDVSFPVAVRQVSGAIARRIVCPVEPGNSFARGEKYGMIKFGSRTELYLPAGIGIEVTVKVGDPVCGGLSVLANLTPAAQDKLRQAQNQPAVNA